jgi:hypothetical protein
MVNGLAQEWHGRYDENRLQNSARVDPGHSSRSVGVVKDPGDQGEVKLGCISLCLHVRVAG